MIIEIPEEYEDLIRRWLVGPRRGKRAKAEELIIAVLIQAANKEKRRQTSAPIEKKGWQKKRPMSLIKLSRVLVPEIPPGTYLDWHRIKKRKAAHEKEK